MSHNNVSDGNDPTAAWMRQLANDPLERSHRPLPDPDLLWMKAQLLHRQSAAEHSLRLARWFETMARVLAGFSAALMAIGIAKLLHVPVIEYVNPTINLTFTSLAIALVLVAAAVVAFPIWSEEE
jgi:uncharacterized membrane protein YfcA